MKTAVPVLTCAMGLFYCVYAIHEAKHAPPPRGQVEIIVYGPDGKVIPAVRKR